MKKLLIIISLIIGIPSIIFIADNYFRSHSQNPFRVAKAFSYSYMIKNSEYMKSWADKKIYEKINELQYSTPVDSSYEDFWEDFELVSFRKLGNTIVCTYAYTDFDNLPLFYSVVLEPTGLSSLWERVKDFIYFDVPLGDKIVGFPYSKQRWLVVDFFTDDDIEEYISVLLEKIEKGAWEDFLIETKQLEQWEQMKKYENKWGDEEKTWQNAEMKKLYMDYLKRFDQNNK